jgi:peptidoglycan/xylan/chitin deacetylase (PgdA/CDA1 family)
VNTGLKRIAEGILVRSGVATFNRARRGRQTLILAYHNVVPNGDAQSGERSLHLRQHDFARQLDILMETAEVVSLSDVLQTPDSSKSNRPRIAITFDDAYAGALTAGIAELARRKLPATIFVAPALLGKETWWDSLADRSTGVVSAEVRDHCLTRLSGKAADIISWAHETRLTGPAQRALPKIGNESQLAEAAAVPGVVLGSHTWSHSNLCALASDEFEGELTLPLRWLRERFANVLPWLSYPYGLHSPEVAAMSARSGYHASVRVDGGWLARTAEPDLHHLPRLNVDSGLSAEGFLLRISGFGATR